MTEKLKWRLSELPDAQGVADLVAQEVITPEEARQILFSDDTEEDSKTIKKLKTELEAKTEEVEFLRELADKLAAKSNSWPTIIREYHDYTPRYPRWYRGYDYIMTAANNTIKDNGSYSLSSTSGTTGKAMSLNVGSMTAGSTNAVMSVSNNSGTGNVQLLSKLNNN